MSVKRAFIKAQKNLNFMDKNIIEKIDSADIFFEDCENCDMRDDCPHPEKFGREGKFLKEMHELFVENEIDSTLHAMTSKDNGDMGKTVCDQGGIMPVETKMTTAGPLCAPDHNFMLVELDDGRKMLYTVDSSWLFEEEEEEKKMMYW